MPRLVGRPAGHDGERLGVAARAGVEGLGDATGDPGDAAAAAWCIDGIGLLLYLGGYLALIILPESGWSTSLVGFAAPAWTPLTFVRTA